MQLIIEAIQNKNKIEFFYKKKHRVVEPYQLGINKHGEAILRAYEGGYGGCLKLWKVAEMSGLKISAEVFLYAKPVFKKSDSQFQKIIATVAA